MSYTSPNINAGAEVKQGLDVPITAIQTAMSEIAWISKSFGRAMTFREPNQSGRTNRIPKVYEDSGEYVNVLPNDNLFSDGVAASSFIRLVGPETYELFSENTGSIKRARLSIIVWANLKMIDPSKDYIFTEELKAEIESKIKGVLHVNEIIEWVDERAEEVFQGYDLETSDFNSEYLMYPYAGVRVDVIVTYNEACNNSSGPTPPECAEMENFTDFVFDGTLELPTLTFSGGNLLGETEVYITGRSVTVMPAGQFILYTQLPLGVTTVTWRKKCGSIFTSFNTKNITVTTLPPRLLRLYPVPGTVQNPEALFTFPLKVANQRLVGGQIVYSDIGLATTGQEYKDIWNADTENAKLGTITTFQFYQFSTVSFWAFTIVPNAGQEYPNYFRGYPI